MGFDIFCRVVDNYGDIGVCWRLARQLASHAPETHVRPHVRLWVDDLTRFAHLVPDFAPGAQTLCGVHIHHWPDAENIQPLDVVIEAFACELPPAFRAQIRTNQHWLNLEYLSAESWVEDCHGLPSPQPNGITKHFFFPGFTAKTGGLLREPELLAQRDGWQADPTHRAALLQSLNVPGLWINGLMQNGWRQVYAFCYPHAPLHALLGDWLANGQTPTVLLAAPGTPTTPNVENLHRVDCPFVAQLQFDALLWGSDLNLVRGEDSFVRALWAARPFLWHIYPQAENAHLTKLEAWLAQQPCPPAAAELMRAWNRPHTPFNDALLKPLTHAADWQAWQTRARQYSARQAQQTDLMQQLLQFVHRPLFPQQPL